MSKKSIVVIAVSFALGLVCLTSALAISGATHRQASIGGACGAQMLTGPSGKPTAPSMSPKAFSAQNVNSRVRGYLYFVDNGTPSRPEVVRGVVAEVDVPQCQTRIAYVGHVLMAYTGPIALVCGVTARGAEFCTPTQGWIYTREPLAKGSY